MNDHHDERRSEGAVDVLAVSRDKVWLEFTRKTLRRNDRVETLKDLREIPAHLSEMDEGTILLISSELIPSKIRDLEESLNGCMAAKMCVLKAPHDEHQRINDKHLRGLGIEVADRPDNAKALRRLIKILVG
jgi:hypothetical protein